MSNLKVNDCALQQYFATRKGIEVAGAQLELAEKVTDNTRIEAATRWANHPRLKVKTRRGDVNVVRSNWASRTGNHAGSSRGMATTPRRVPGSLDTSGGPR